MKRKLPFCKTDWFTTKLMFAERKTSHLKKLSGLFSNMDTVGNLVAASLFNGSFLF
jgi:hypothetical protein